MSDHYQPRKAEVVDIVGDLMFVCDEQGRYHQMLQPKDTSLGDKGTVTFKKPNWKWTKQQPS